MVIIIHGDDIVTSRKKLSELKETKQTSLTLEAKTLNLERIKQEFEGGGLFGEEKIIAIENFLSSPDKDVLFYLAHSSLPFDLVFWEEKNLTPAILNNFPKAQVFQFKLKAIIFSFLESLRPGNYQTMLKLFHENLKNTEIEMIFYLLIRQFRLMLAVSEEYTRLHLDTGCNLNKFEKIEELKKLQTWQLERLKRQTAFFKQERLVDLYQKLFEMEIKQKTGSSPLSLTAALDLFILTI